MRIHARVTKEIEITNEQAKKLVNYLCGCVENSNIDSILEKFTNDTECGDYEAGYIPYEWLFEDLKKQCDKETVDYLEGNSCVYDDIEL